MLNRLQNGFTLIELLVVIAIVGVLASVILSSLTIARAKARDARRMSDMAQAAKAMAAWEIDHNDGYMGTASSGCGSDTNLGSGWFNYKYGANTPNAVCLVDGGYTSAEIIDPTGSRSGSTPTNGVYTYMKYSCTQSGVRTAYVYAKLETRPQSSTATDGTCHSGADTSYGMNYFVQVQ